MALPRSMRCNKSTSPSTSVTSCRASWMVWRTSGWSGISRTPATFSAHAFWSGNTIAARSSACMRWMGGGTLRPGAQRGTASDTLAFQRQRMGKMGESSRAWVSTSRAVRLCRYAATSSRSKLCVSPSDSTMASSVAAACNSKLNRRQNRLRRAKPQARLIRPPRGLWTTSCIPPASSKKRSMTGLSAVGIAPSAAWPAARYSTSWRAAAGGKPISSPTRPATVSTAAAGSAVSAASRTRRPTIARKRDTAADSAALRAGASPSQNGMVGGCPPASSTRMRSNSTRRMRHACRPSWKTSPGRLSMAKSSFTVPMVVSPGSRTTR